jgi:hypothetical protein
MHTAVAMKTDLTHRIIQVSAVDPVCPRLGRIIHRDLPESKRASPVSPRSEVDVLSP